MIAALLALAAAAVWGTADFGGGALSRRLPATWVLAVSQLAGLAAAVLAAAPAAALGLLPRPGVHLVHGAAAGLLTALGVGALYRALSLGTMSVVAPIAGTGLVVPVVAGLVAGERPGALQLAGIVAATLGVVLASGPELRGAAGSRRSIPYAVVAALGLGGALVFMAEGSDVDVATTLVAAFAAGTVATLPWLLRRPAGATGRDLGGASLVGAGNLGATLCFGWASTLGLVSVVSVLTSLYPVVTVLLARRVYRERLKRIQVAGVAAALLGVALLAT